MSDSPWRSHYDAGVPVTLFPYPERTLVDVVRETVRERPAHPAFLFKGARLSYGDFDRLSDAFAVSLIALGVKKGDRVAIMLPNCPQALIAQFGVWKAGAIASPINPLYTEHELAHALAENGAEVAVVLTPFYGKLKALQSRSKLRHIIATSIKEYLPPLLRIAFTVLKEKKEGHRVTLLQNDTWFQDELSRKPGGPAPAVQVSPADHALLLFSGGTTGLPKAVLIRHHSLVIAAIQLRAWFDGVLDDWVNPIVATFPMFHVAGDVAILSVGLLTRNPIALVPNPRDLEDLLKTIKREKIAFLPAVPTLLNSIMARAADPRGGVDLRSIRLTLAGSAPLLSETKRRFEALTGGRVINVYSMTEAVMATISSPALGKFKEGSIGLPLPDVELRIVDAETGQHEVATGEVGELLIRAPQLMEGYYNRPDATAEMLRDGWLYTGDLGFMDEDGYVTLVDRKKDVIKPSGFQVWPTEVEESIATHPSVAEVCVAGVPDARQSEAVKAWVVLRPATTLTADDLRAHCRATLAAYKIPRHVAFRTSLPKSAVGKILRRELVKEDAAANATREDS